MSINMELEDNVTEQLKFLIDSYDFNIDTLSQYLKLPAEKVKCLSNGDIDFLPEDSDYRFELFTKIQLLYFTITDDKDSKLCAFLEVLISYHHLSKKTIAKIAGIEVTDIEKMLSNPPEKTDIETKYKIAVTVMALRFFLKDCEQ